MRTQLSVRLLLIFALVAGCGKFVSPATRIAFDELVAIQLEVQQARQAHDDPDDWSKKVKVWIPKPDQIQQVVKGGVSGSAERDVSRMGRALREMLNTANKIPSSERAANAPSEYERASKAFQDYTTAAARKLEGGGK